MSIETPEPSPLAHERLLAEAVSRLARVGRALVYMGLDRVGGDLMRIAREVEDVAKACRDTRPDSPSDLGRPAPSDAQS
jgi:hypothetical protein